jgi:hypothetical protein
MMLWTDHPLLATRLSGLGLMIRLPTQDGRYAVRLGAARLSSSAERIGIPCAGLIQPGTCAPERMRDDAELSEASLGAWVRLVGLSRVTLALTGDLSADRIHVDSRGLVSGGELAASKTLWGAGVGVEVAWIPLQRLPLALEAEAGFNSLFALTEERIIDGYTPLEDGMKLTRLRLGVTWRPR